MSGEDFDELVKNFKMPTDKDLAIGHANWVNGHEPNQFSFWFPRLLELNVKVPKTDILKFGSDISELGFGEGAVIDGYDDYVQKVKDACNRMGYPCFLRSGLTSAKHDWKDTCCIGSEDDVALHMLHINEFCAMVDLPVTEYVVREMLPTKPQFKAFWGEMPIVQEFRIFVKNGILDHFQPYWPEHSIEKPDNENWKQLLAYISHLPLDFKFLSEQSEMVGRHFGGYWSIDWLKVRDDWYLTDMATGESSYDTRTEYEINKGKI
jgi:hypothetical protein